MATWNTKSKTRIHPVSFIRVAKSRFKVAISSNHYNRRFCFVTPSNRSGNRLSRNCQPLSGFTCLNLSIFDRSTPGTKYRRFLPATPPTAFAFNFWAGTPHSSPDDYLTTHITTELLMDLNSLQHRKHTTTLSFSIQPQSTWSESRRPRLSVTAWRLTKSRPVDTLRSSKTSKEVALLIADNALIHTKTETLTPSIDWGHRRPRITTAFDIFPITVDNRLNNHIYHSSSAQDRDQNLTPTAPLTTPLELIWAADDAECDTNSEFSWAIIDSAHNRSRQLQMLSKQKSHQHNQQRSVQLHFAQVHRRNCILPGYG